MPYHIEICPILSFIATQQTVPNQTFSGLLARNPVDVVQSPFDLFWHRLLLVA